MPISMNLWKIALVKMTCNLIKKKYQVELIKYNCIDEKLVVDDLSLLGE